MFGEEIVIKEDCVVRVSAQEFLRLFDGLGHVDKIAFEAERKPFVPPCVVVKQKNAYGMTFSFC